MLKTQTQQKSQAEEIQRHLFQNDFRNACCEVVGGRRYILMALRQCSPWQWDNKMQQSQVAAREILIGHRKNSSLWGWLSISRTACGIRLRGDFQNMTRQDLGYPFFIFQLDWLEAGIWTRWLPETLSNLIFSWYCDSILTLLRVILTEFTPSLEW